MEPRILAWERVLLDNLVKQETASETFDEWVNLPGNYRPTILWDMFPSLSYLARSYDGYQLRRGDLRRVYPELNEEARKATRQRLLEDLR